MATPRQFSSEQSNEAILADLLAVPDHAKQLELIQWHILRYDQLRAYAANRAAIVLSANTLLIAGISFTLDTVLKSTIPLPFGVVVLVIIGTIALFGAIAVSVFSAMQTIVSLKRTRELSGQSVAHRMFFNASDTLRAYPTYRQFRAEFLQQTPMHVLDAALGELYSITHQYRHRYHFLRLSIIWLFGAMVLAVVVLLLSMGIRLGEVSIL